MRIPRVEEQVDIGRRQVETGRVHIGRSLHEHTETVEVPLRRDEVEVRRVRVDRPVDAPVPVRQEGDVTIVSLHDEIAVVHRQLVVTEELHIRKRVDEVRETHQVTLRGEQIEVDRQPPPSAARGPRDPLPQRSDRK